MSLLRIQLLEGSFYLHSLELSFHSLRDTVATFHVKLLPYILLLQVISLLVNTLAQIGVSSVAPCLPPPL